MKNYHIGAAVFSVSWSGYIREKAVENWPKINSSFELSLLLIRLNDWVAPVRLAAVKKISSLTSLPVSESGLTISNILGCMDLILCPNRFGRSSEIELNALSKFADLHGIPKALSDHILLCPDDSAPRYLKLSLQNGRLGNSLQHISKNGRHPDVRRIATKALLDGKYAWKLRGKLQHTVINYDIDKVELAKCSLDDKSPAMRRIALSYIIETKPIELFTEHVFRRFVTDKRISIVERAVFGLQSLGINYIDEIREKIKAGSIPMHAFDILGRKGNVEDGRLIYTLIPTIAGAKKTHALGIAAKLQNSEAIKDLANIAFLQTDNNMARAASKELSKMSYVPDFSILRHAVDTGEDVSARGYLPLIRNLPTMELALAISELEYIGDVDGLTSLWNTLVRKRNAGAFMPSAEEISAVSNSAKHSQTLRDKIHRLLGVEV
ncbi:MAG: hypothetical protein L3J05_02360 [Robiginitomaculum sp.]|nr:hypothetical protein [Robiginitomaculum sp.]